MTGFIRITSGQFVFSFLFFFRKKERKEKLKCEKIRKKREIIEKKGPLKARRGSKADGSKREREM